MRSLGTAAAAVNLLRSSEPDDKQLSDIEKSVQDAHLQLCARLQELLTAAHLQDLKNRTAAQLTEPRDLERERVRR